MQILIGELSHETNSFSTVKTTEERFRENEWISGEDILTVHNGVKDYLGGMIDEAKNANIEVIPTVSANALPSGLIEKETYEKIKQQFLNAIKEAPQFDGICFALHGAGVVDGIGDLEGDFLEAVRGVVGDDLPIVVTLDLHGNISEKMVTHADAMFGVNYYPHTDSYERGVEAIQCMRQILKKEINPVMSLVKLPLLVPTVTSDLSPIVEINEKCWKAEQDPGIMDCTFFHGFPYTDIPEVGASILVVGDEKQESADEVSRKIAAYIWEHRSLFFKKMRTPEEALKEAISLEGRPIVLNETSDNPGAGTPCDGTRLLDVLLRSGVEEDVCFGMLYDPEVVQRAHTAGAGATVEVNLGGKTDHLHGEPIPVKAYVKALADGQFQQTSPMWLGKNVDVGKTARLQINGVDVVIGCRRNQVFDEQVFLLHGIDVHRYKIVALKSSQHFRARYKDIAKHIIPVDSPGLSTLNLHEFSYENIEGLVYPLDEETEFKV